MIWPALVLLLVFVLYVLVKVIGYMRTSEEQWQRVDKTKLRRWEDDEDD